MLDYKADPLTTMSVASSNNLEISKKLTMKKSYSTYLSSKAVSAGSLKDLMNGAIKKKLKIIPKNVQ